MRWFNSRKGEKGAVDQGRTYFTEAALGAAFASLATGECIPENFTALAIGESAGAITSTVQAFSHDDNSKFLDAATSGAAALGAFGVAGLCSEYVPPPYLFAFALGMQALKNLNIACHSKGEKLTSTAITAGSRSAQSLAVIQGLILGLKTKPLMWLGTAGSLTQIVSSAVSDIRGRRRARDPESEQLIAVDHQGKSAEQPAGPSVV
jgi:hypothetical protein